jgi:hypothetical protein
MTSQNLADRIFEKTFLTFRNVLGGPVPPLTPPGTLANAPQLAAPEDYEATATLYGNRYRGAFVLNFSLGFVAVLLALIPLAGLLDEHLLHEIAPLLTVAELSTIFIILLIHLYGRDPETYGVATGWLKINQGWRQRWGHARLAAEHVRYSDLMLGFPGRQLHAGGMLDNAGPHYRETARTLGALAAQCAVAPADEHYTGAYRAHFLDVIRYQSAYHRNNAQRYHHIHHRLHQIASWCFYLTLLVCLAHFGLHHPALSVLAALLPALAATCHGLLAAGEFHKLSEQSHDMGKALGNLEKEVMADSAAPLSTLEGQVLAFFGLVVQDAIGWHVTLRDKDVQVA